VLTFSNKSLIKTMPSFWNAKLCKNNGLIQVCVRMTSSMLHDDFHNDFQSLIDTKTILLSRKQYRCSHTQRRTLPWWNAFVATKTL